MNQQDGYVTHTIEHGVGIIEFHHPESNTLPTYLLTELQHQINDLGMDTRVKVIKLMSAGHAKFCGGASFEELSNISTVAEGTKFFMAFGNVMNAMRTCHKLIVGCVHGPVVGGGLGIVAACDYVVADPTASVKFTDLSFGIAPIVAGLAVERKIGISAYSTLAIDSMYPRDASWAKRYGLYSEVPKESEGYSSLVDNIVDRLAHSSPDAMAHLKKVLWLGTDHWEKEMKRRAEINSKLALSDFTRNTIRKVTRITA